MRSILDLQVVTPSKDYSSPQASILSQSNCSRSSWISWSNCH